MTDFSLPDQPYPTAQAEKPDFNAPMYVWHIARAAIPDTIEWLGEACPAVRKALERAEKGGWHEVEEIWMMPEEARELWDYGIFTRVQKGNGIEQLPTEPDCSGLADDRKSASGSGSPVGTG